MRPITSDPITIPERDEIVPQFEPAQIHLVGQCLDVDFALRQPPIHPSCLPGPAGRGTSDSSVTSADNRRYHHDLLTPRVDVLSLSR